MKQSASVTDGMTILRIDELQKDDRRLRLSLMSPGPDMTVRRWVALLLLTALAVGCSARGSPSTPSGVSPSTTETLGTLPGGSGEPVTSAQFGVDPDFIEAVLDDGTVTFEEFDLAVKRKYGCMLDEGVEGRVALDLALNYDAAAVLLHDSREVLRSVVAGCQGSIQPIVSSFVQDNPYNTPEIVERQRQGVLACISKDAPAIYEDLSDEWHINTLAMWVYDQTTGYGETASSAAADCIGTYGAPWISLEEAAGRK